MPDVNPKILQWARETAGITPEEAVDKLDINEARGVAAIDRLSALENGTTAPTRTMLVKMAKQYRRPLLTFYLPSIPKKGDRGEDFRTLPDTVDRTETALVDAVVRDIRARQALVRAALEATDEAEALSFVGSMKRSQGVAKVVNAIEDTIGFDLKIFRKGNNQLVKGFSYLRQLVESAGIFVLLIDNLGSHYTTIGVDVFRGFALADDVAPFVAVNANDSPGAWAFTLVHELAHLWLGATGISGGTGEREIEKFCNDVASELLVPMNEVEMLNVDGNTPFSEAMTRISEFAEGRNVSSTMIAYKLYRFGAIDFDRFQAFKSAYRERFLAAKASQKERQKDQDRGPSYYTVKMHRVGISLIRFVERMMLDGNLSTTKAGKVLGIAPQNVHALLNQARPKRAA